VPDVVTSAPTKNIGGDKTGRLSVYSTKSGKLLWTADGHPGDQLGTGVEGAGDTNRDGIPDVIARAPGGGYARIYSGRDGRVLLTLHAEDKGDDFGRHAAGVGDVNRDGFADVIAGAPGNSAQRKGAGRAYVYSGKDGRLIKTFTSRIPGDTFGFDAVTMDDVDGDGVADFLITSGWSGIHGYHSGRVFIISSGVKPIK
jgi:hypothetical protein